MVALHGSCFDFHEYFENFHYFGNLVPDRGVFELLSLAEISPTYPRGKPISRRDLSTRIGHFRGEREERESRSSDSTRLDLAPSGYRTREKRKIGQGTSSTPGASYLECRVEAASPRETPITLFPRCSFSRFALSRPSFSLYSDEKSLSRDSSFTTPSFANDRRRLFS